MWLALRTKPARIDARALVRPPRLVLLGRPLTRLAVRPAQLGRPSPRRTRRSPKAAAGHNGDAYRRYSILEFGTLLELTSGGDTLELELPRLPPPLVPFPVGGLRLLLPPPARLAVAASLRAASPLTVRQSALLPL